MNRITDMLGQEIRIGDRIACSFRTQYGTAPELRIGVVMDFVERKSSERNGLPKGTRPAEQHLKVIWTDSSMNVERNLRMEDFIAKAAARGKSYPDAIRNQKYREHTSEILVRLQRFVKLG